MCRLGGRHAERLTVSSVAAIADRAKEGDQNDTDVQDDHNDPDGHDPTSDQFCRPTSATQHLQLAIGTIPDPTTAIGEEAQVGDDADTLLFRSGV